MLDSNRHAARYSLGCLLIGVALISGCLASCVWLVKWADGDFEIATFDCGSNRQIVITAARSWEISQPIHYLVRVDGEIVVPNTYIDNNNPDNDPSAIQFKLFTTSDGNIVGITYADNTSDFLFIHDFVNNASFPRGDHIEWDDTLGVNENRRVRDRARAELESKLNSSSTQ